MLLMLNSRSNLARSFRGSLGILAHVLLDLRLCFLSLVDFFLAGLPLCLLEPLELEMLSPEETSWEVLDELDVLGILWEMEDWEVFEDVITADDDVPPPELLLVLMSTTYSFVLAAWSVPLSTAEATSADVVASCCVSC